VDWGRRGAEMDLDSKVNHQMAREMRHRIDELESAISLMRTLRDEMEELYSELFGVSWPKMK
jgi:hypothetical protein